MIVKELSECNRQLFVWSPAPDKRCTVRSNFNKIACVFNFPKKFGNDQAFNWTFVIHVHHYECNECSCSMNSFSCKFIKPWTNSFIDRTLGYAIKASQCNAEEAFQNVFFYNFTFVEEGKKGKLSIQCFDRFPGFSSLWSVIGWLMPQPMFLSAQAIYRIWESCCWWYLHFVWAQLSLTARHFLALSVIWIYWIILTKLDHISRKGGITSSLSIFILFQCVT